MKVTLVGVAGSFPGPDSSSSCYLVEHDGFSVLLDLGNGSLGALQRFHDIYDIDAVLLSHLHADHCLDLASYYVARKYHPEGAKPPIPVYAPPGAGARMARAYDMDADPGMAAEFTFIDHSLSPVDLGPFRLTTALMAHAIDNYGMRLDAGGRSVVYSGDTGPTDELVRLSKGVDLALFEASLLDGRHPPNLHMSSREAAAHAARAGVGELVLTHLVAWNDRQHSLEQAAPAFDGTLTLAETGRVIEL